MLTVITGNVRTGKTLLAIILATTTTREIVSNIHLKEKFPKVWSELDIAKLFRNEYSKSFILIDEAWSYFHARRSQSAENISFGAMLKQSGKGDNHLVLTTQRFESIDVDFRDLITERIHVERNGKWIRYSYWTAERPTESVEKYMDLDKCSEFFAMYDTKEIVEFGIKTQNTLMFEKADKLEIRLNDLAKEFYQWTSENGRPINTVGCQQWCLRTHIPHAFRSEIIFQAKMMEKANKIEQKENSENEIETVNNEETPQKTPKKKKRSRKR